MVCIEEGRLLCRGKLTVIPNVRFKHFPMVLYIMRYGMMLTFPVIFFLFYLPIVLFCFAFFPCDLFCRLFIFLSPGGGGGL